jgi:hypothetical protein
VGNAAWGVGAGLTVHAHSRWANDVGCMAHRIPASSVSANVGRVHAVSTRTTIAANTMMESPTNHRPSHLRGPSVIFRPRKKQTRLTPIKASIPKIPKTISPFGNTASPRIREVIISQIHRSPTTSAATPGRGRPARPETGFRRWLTGFVGGGHLLLGLNRTVMKFVSGGEDIGLNHPERGIAIGS